MLIRIFDILISIFLLVITFPILVLTAFLIKLDSRGPVFFWQKRVGQNYKEFWILKFRTMYHSKASRSLITSKNNLNQITRIGGIIRKLHLDELVQLYNVLKGEMELVGPRPEVPKYTKYHEGLWKEVLLVKPGITGYATVKCAKEEYNLLSKDSDPEKVYKNEILPEKLKTELYYIKNKSLKLNMLIIFKTFVKIFL